MKVLEILPCNNHYFVKHQAIHYNFFYIKTLISVLSLLLGWTVYWLYSTRSYFYTLRFPKDLIEWNIFFYWGLIPNMSVLNCNFHSLTCLTYMLSFFGFLTHASWMRRSFNSWWTVISAKVCTLLNTFYVFRSHLSNLFCRTILW
jgi:hypothetical protein